MLFSNWNKFISFYNAADTGWAFTINANPDNTGSLGGNAGILFNTGPSLTNAGRFSSSQNLLIQKTIDNGFPLQVNGLAQAYAFGGSNNVTVSALGTNYTIFNAAYNGIAAIRDNTTGGTDLWLIDPNFGTIKIAGNITKVYSITFSGGVYVINQSIGSVPTNYGFAILTA